MAEVKRRVPIIVGPTGVGKTALAVALADHWPVTVISADSRQVYRGLDIGTAKPPSDVLERVPHLGLDVVAPGESYSAGRFARDAARWLAGLGAARQPLVVGGTGFYVKALADGLFREPPLDAERRTALRRWSATAPDLGRWAVRLDPHFGGGGRQRAARTVEVALLTGRPLSWWQAQAKDARLLDPWYVRLSAPRAVLHQRIESRAAAMLEAGWIDEVQAMLASGLDGRAPGLDAVGYREIIRHLRGELDRDALVSAVAAGTRRYAKRQETWFRHQLEGPVLNVDASGPVADQVAMVLERWREEQG